MIGQKKEAFLTKFISKTKKEKNNMETQNAVQDEKSETVILADIPRSENDIYRISRKDYKGNRYLDLRSFFRAKDDRSKLVPSAKACVLRRNFANPSSRGSSRPGQPRRP